MAGFAIHDNNYHMYITESAQVKPTLNDFIYDITSIGAIGGSREETDTSSFSTIGKDKTLGAIDNGTVDVTGNQTKQQYQYFMNLLNLNKKLYAWIAIYDDDKQPQLYQRFAFTVSQVQSGDGSVNGLVTWTATMTISGIVLFTAWQDPMGATSGKPITKLTVAGFAGRTTITEPGGSLMMGCDVEPYDASNPAYSWSVDDTGVAEINIGGRLKALKNGTVTVTATAEDGSGVTGETEITITGQTESAG